MDIIHKLCVPPLPDDRGSGCGVSELGADRVYGSFVCTCCVSELGCEYISQVCLTFDRIYLVRYSITSYYDYRSSSQQKYLQSLQKQRDAAISKLKEATKYNTTQQLLEKYGGTPQKQAGKAKKEKNGEQLEENMNLRKRRETTGFVPPPTANIPGRRIVSASVPGSPQFPDPNRPQALTGPQPPQSAAAAVAPWRQEQVQQSPAGAEFAPNAFSEPRVYASNNEGPKWYDRLMDVVLGEDESNPKNRLALICQSCRLVNGQAPPGMKTLEDVGKWKCSACGELNGEDSEARRIVAKIQAQADGAGSTPASPIAEEQEPNDEDEEAESDYTVYTDEEASEQPVVVEKPVKKRGRPKKSG